jgi:glycosyltransferase involved in cell wall biosynthesis
MKALFWIAVLGAIYSYAVYPLILSLLPPRRRAGGVVAGGEPQDAGSPAGVAGQASRPLVTLVIACRNERARIAHKLDNALAVHYPRLEIVVASDCSDDGSDQIVESYAGRGVRLARSPERRGKEHAQGLAIGQARGEIVVFSDAGTDLPPDSIDHVVEDFSDAAVGAVSSEDTFISADGSVAGEGLYVRYEMWLRRLESRVGSLVGLSGSFFAVRRPVLQRWDAAIPSDFASAINTVRAGMVAISDPRVRGIYRDIKDPAREYPRKVRTAIRGMAALGRIPEVLNPLRYGTFAFQVWSHKLMRWLVPWFLVLALAANLALVGEEPLYLWLLGLQLAGYACVGAAHFAPALRNFGPLRIAYYFVQANVALAEAGARYLAGQRVTVWEPSVR